MGETRVEYARASPSDIAEVLSQDRKTGRSDYTWWLAQALFYGIPPSTNVDNILQLFEDKFVDEGPNLWIPARITQLSRKLCLQYDRRIRIQSAAEEKNTTGKVKEDSATLQGEAASDEEFVDEGRNDSDTSADDQDRNEKRKWRLPRHSDRPVPSIESEDASESGSDGEDMSNSSSRESSDDESDGQFSRSSPDPHDPGSKKQMRSHFSPSPLQAPLPSHTGRRLLEIAVPTYFHSATDYATASSSPIPSPRVTGNKASAKPSLNKKSTKSPYKKKSSQGDERSEVSELSVEADKVMQPRVEQSKNGLKPTPGKLDSSQSIPKCFDFFKPHTL